MSVLLSARATAADSCELQTDDGRKEPRVLVDSEDEPLRTLLETRICKEDGFQKQQGMWFDATAMAMALTQAETLIVWTEPQTGIDMALSFQEADGCAQIWYVLF